MSRILIGALILGIGVAAWMTFRGGQLPTVGEYESENKREVENFGRKGVVAPPMGWAPGTQDLTFTKPLSESLPRLPTDTASDVAKRVKAGVRGL